LENVFACSSVITHATIAHRRGPEKLAIIQRIDGHGMRRGQAAFGVALASKHRSASLIRSKFAMSVTVPSGRRKRCMPAHFESGTIRGSSFSVTDLPVFVPGVTGLPVTLRNECWATWPTSAVPCVSGARSGARLARLRQVAEQKRAVDRRASKGRPHCWQVRAIIWASLRISWPGAAEHDRPPFTETAGRDHFRS
jgi:hypothetical protein